jgi:AraC-like DNA-binding protein
MGQFALSNFTVSPPSQLAFDDWTSQLQTVCGNYHPHAHEKSETVNGYVGLLQAGGIDLAHIANNIGDVRREASDIKRDYGENLFLLIQLEGTCGIEQIGRQSIIEPGDCILIDSSRPSLFHFGGNYSNHLSVHMPRQLLFSKNTQSLEVSRRVDAQDPMATMLSALVAKLATTDVADKRAPHLRQLLFDTTRQAFATDEEIEVLPSLGSTDGRLEIVQILIDRHLTDEHLTPRWLAKKMGISMRTLQDDFSGYGTTPTSLIRLRRLHLAKEQLMQHKGQAGRVNIAELALSAGFNDISYFNRCFRDVFHCTPRDLLNEQ